jgi:hypothetical protein
MVIFSIFIPYLAFSKGFAIGKVVRHERFMMSGFFGQGRAAVFRATWGATSRCCKKSTKFGVS